IRWLESQSVSGAKNTKQEEFIQNICFSHNLLLTRDMLISKYDSSEKIANKIIDLGQVILEISSLWTLQSGRKTRNIIDTVEEFIKKTQVSYQREQRYTGVSDRQWRPHFYTTFQGNNTLTHILSADNKSAAKPILCAVNTQWEDLEKYKAESNYNFISLIIDEEDSKNIWTAGDQKLLRKRTEVKKWSRKEDFKDALLRVG
ncbi:MAG: hypothetical protein WA896_01085, partial [Spirulinaceae cyanobacterium]